ncbi:MAG TPA: hypothetical protein PK752_10255 [Accumulibacter sp.]|uniref:hypothetical protein n=1 Tax=Accumulibacter sp. TaxID=2053492 RepID=UPI002D0393DE|nr:hypothetical protein [Accumulibacter sp.]HRD88617.1 hypothetical protein [Accumulibacter sp.]
MLNLEPLAALAANEMAGDDRIPAKDAENIITKSLAVLAEQGLYAFGLFLATRKAKDQIPAQRIDQKARELLRTTDLDGAEQTTVSTMPDFYRSITAPRPGESATEALRRILLAKQLLETALTYGRYVAKASANRLKNDR